MTTEAPAVASCCSTTNTEALDSDRENLLADAGCCGSPVEHAAEPASDAEHQHGYIDDKSGYLTRMKRIEGQARGIARMIDEEKYCIDILTQISALTRALQTVATGLLDDHLKHCVLDAARMGDEDAAREKLQEASDAIKRLVRS